MPRTYLDHAATTPMVPAAIEAMTAQLGRAGNPSSLHTSGRNARRVVEEGRELIADRVGARPSEVIFTSGGTEADNLALKGAFWARADAGRTTIVVSAVEHHAVLDPVAWLAESAGADVRMLPVDVRGAVEESVLDAGIDARTAVVSLIWGNNEVGTIQPVVAAARWARERGAVSHCDAVQAVGHVPVDFAATGLDLLTFTGHKLGGPYGIGALLARRDVRLTAIQHGGGQERNVRSGTLDVAAVAGFAAAVDQAVGQIATEQARIAELRDVLVAGVLERVPEARLNGPADGERLPGIVNVGFPGALADSILMLLDGGGIDCSTGSACTAGVSQASHVLLAMGQTPAAARSALRFSLGHSTTRADVWALLGQLPDAVARARTAAGH